MMTTSVICDRCKCEIEGPISYELIIDKVIDADDGGIDEIENKNLCDDCINTFRLAFYDFLKTKGVIE
jgi:hypothetical protein